VLVGVGHEIDRSVADEVAHTSAKTPTACAAVLVEAVDRFTRRLDAAAARLQALTGRHLGSAQDRLVVDAGRLARAARHTVQRREVDLDHAARRLGQAPGRRLERAGGWLATASARLSAVDPEVALARGWTITRTDSGRLVRSIAEVKAGTVLRTTTMDGMIASTVTATTPTGSSDAGAPTE
jgi:exodeoxyribonuclease VII large subunit